MALVDGAAQSDQFVRLLLELELVEPIQVTASLDSGKRLELEALYTINEERVRALPDDVAGEFNRNGALKLIYTQIQSLQKFDALVALKNRHAAGVLA